MNQIKEDLLRLEMRLKTDVDLYFNPLVQELLAKLDDIIDDYILVKKDKVEKLSSYNIERNKDSVSIVRNLELHSRVTLDTNVANNMMLGTSMTELGHTIDLYTKYCLLEKLLEKLEED